MKQTLTCLLFFIFFSQLHAQFRCGFDAGTARLRGLDPSYQKNTAGLNTLVRNQIAAQKGNKGRTATLSGGAIVYIPCVVQVIHTGGAVGSAYNPGNATIASAINYLNAVFDGSWSGAGGSILGVGDVQVKFVLATKDPQNNPTTGIVRVNASGLANYPANGINAGSGAGAGELAVKNLSRWDPFKYYNIWLVNKIDGCDGISGCPSFTAGYAYFPPSGYSAAIARDLDGTVMLASQMAPGQKTLPHEVGHAFGLYHPFEGEADGPGPNGCPPANPALGDECGDTAPVTNPADDGAPSPFACRTGTNPCSGTAFNGNTEQNFMNYTTCYRLFTADQKDRMQAAALVTMRASLATSWANNQGAYPTIWAAPVAAAVTPASANAVSNVTGILSVTLNGRTIHSLDATEDGGYTNGAADWYNLFELQPATAYTMAVQLSGFNYEQLGVYLDYNGNGSFNNTTERLFYQNDIDPANGGLVSFSFTTPATAPSAPLRLRISEDLATGYGVPALTASSTSFQYGQAEDYPLFIGQAVVLPVELTRFEGYRFGGGIRLAWAGAAETSLEAYELERSADGRNFSLLAIVLPNRLSEYEFDDRHATTGSWQYRLKIKETNGASSYSRVLRFGEGGDKAPVVLTNPFTDHIDLALPRNDQPYRCRLLDAAGRMILRSSGNSSGGRARIDVGTANLSRGVYVLELVQDGKTYRFKVAK